MNNEMIARTYHLPSCAFNWALMYLNRDSRSFVLSHLTLWTNEEQREPVVIDVEPVVIVVAERDEVLAAELVAVVAAGVISPPVSIVLST